MELSSIKTKIISLLSNIKPVYIYVFVGIIIAIEAVWGYQTLVKTTTPSLSQSSSQTQSNAQNFISLTVPKSQFKIGEIIPVGININSNTSTIGTDLIIHYDPNLLIIAPASLNAPVTVGGIYDEYPLNSVDSKKGIIAVSGITNQTKGVIPKGLFGTILFQAKAAGTAKVFLNFAKGKTNDTNLIDIKSSADILEEVRNVDITIIQ